MSTTPLARTFKTTEGVATLVVGTAVSALSGVDPSTLPHSVAAVVAGALSLGLLAQRGLIKIAAIKALGVDPIGYIKHELLDEAEAASDVPPVA